MLDYLLCRARAINVTSSRGTETPSHSCRISGLITLGSTRKDAVPRGQAYHLPLYQHWEKMRIVSAWVSMRTSARDVTDTGLMIDIPGVRDMSNVIFLGAYPTAHGIDFPNPQVLTRLTDWVTMLSSSIHCKTLCRFV